MLTNTLSEEGAFEWDGEQCSGILASFCTLEYYIAFVQSGLVLLSLHSDTKMARRNSHTALGEVPPLVGPHLLLWPGGDLWFPELV